MDPRHTHTELMRRGVIYEVRVSTSVAAYLAYKSGAPYLNMWTQPAQSAHLPPRNSDKLTKNGLLNLTQPQSTHQTGPPTTHTIATMHNDKRNDRNTRPRHSTTTRDNGGAARFDDDNNNNGNIAHT